VGIRLIHLMAFGKANFGQLLGRGVDIRAFAGSAGSNLDLIETIHRSAPVLEQLLMGREGTTVSYAKRSQAAFEPVLESNPMEEWEHRSKDIFRQGVFGYQALWSHFRRTKPSIAAEISRDKQGWCRLLHRLIAMPTYEEARLIGDLHNDCNFGSIRTAQMCPPEEEESIRQMGAYEYYRFMRHKSPAVWPQGSITRVDPGVILSHYCTQSDTGYFERMLAFCRSLTAEGIMKVVVYGAGVVGRNFIRAARLSGLSVLCAADRNAQLWGTRLEGIDVMSLEAAICAGNHHYAVASFAFSGEIRDTIHAAYRGLNLQPKIFMPGYAVRHEAPRPLINNDIKGSTRTGI